MDARAETGPAERIEIALRGRLGAFRLDIAFEAPMRGVTALFGPSGSGKTSVLRWIAGLQRLGGRLTVGGETWQGERRFRPPHRREVGYVFQEPSLFAHLSVRRNLLYGARRAAKTHEAGAAGFEEVVGLLGLGHLLDRNPARLSGGERQRVALGRALLSRPRLLLMDEPLSALDRSAKEEILPYFERLHSSLAVPIFYVSHDLSEVERLADRIVILADGRVAAAGPLNAALTDAGLGFADRSDFAAVLDARVTAFDEVDRLAELDLHGQPIFVGGTGERIGAILRVRIAASDVSLSLKEPAQSTILNVLRGRISAIEPSAEAHANVFLTLEGTQEARFVARVTRRSLRRLGLAPGRRVFAQIKSVSLAAAPEGRGT